MSSTTGKPLNRFSAKIFTASDREVLAVTVMGLGVMISAIVFVILATCDNNAFSLHLIIRVISHRLIMTILQSSGEKMV
ncbi:hypothetical protein MICAK_1310007 [Microcystis aeruginosa PCC 9701]|uniref:Uncharacterized protein n=1 Tax=Microcystis aeruginosa PCC 9701 TaxID=721123 RepID=I4IL99_MICAE|nr:hypothetical protein MICAK_1310007 [Microcystis aeruginosa PCC 9701]